MGISIDRREKNIATRLDQFGAGANDLRRVGHMLEHLETGYGVEFSWLACGQRLSGRLLIGDRRAGFGPMQLGNRQRPVGHVDAQDISTGGCQRFGQDATTTTYIDDSLVWQRNVLANPVEAQQIYRM